MSRSVPLTRHVLEFATTWERATYVDAVAVAVAVGGYPEVTSLDPRSRNAWLDSYLDRIVQVDAGDVRRVSDPNRLRSLLRLIAAAPSGELVKGRLATAADVPAASITAYLDVLRTLFLVDLLPPWTPNLTRREIGRPKASLADSALAVRSSRLSTSGLVSLGGSDHLGPLLESLVTSELQKQRGWSDAEFELFHFRDRNGLEADLLVELYDGTVVAIEVKASSTYRGEQFAGLRELRDRLGDRFRAGFVLGTAQHGIQFADRLYGLPVAALWELGDESAPGRAM